MTSSQAEIILLRLEVYGLGAVAAIDRHVLHKLDHRSRTEIYMKLRELGLSADEIAMLNAGKHLAECDCAVCESEASRKRVRARLAGKPRS